MSTSFPTGPGAAKPPYGYGQPPGYTGPPTNASGSGGAVIMIVIALGVVILLGLACAGAAVGFLLFARASHGVARMEEEAQAVRMDAMATQADMEASPVEVVQPEPFLPTDPARARWSYPGSPEGASGSIAQLDANNWLETGSDHRSIRFTEVDRTAEYVELFDQQRQLYVRLLADHMEWKKDGQEWFRGQGGAWDAPSPLVPTVGEPPPPTDAQTPQP
jgi:hypothetical protein